MKNRVWVHPDSWASPTKSVRTITFCTCHGTTGCLAQNVSTSFYCDMSISIKQYFICASSVGPFGPPEEEKGVKHMFFVFLENCFSRAAWNLFDVGDQSVPTHLASNIPFGSFQCSFSALWRGVKRRPHRGGSQSSQEAEVTAVHRLTTPLPSFSLADTKRIGFSVEHSALHP